MSNFKYIQNFSEKNSRSVPTLEITKKNMFASDLAKIIMRLVQTLPIQNYVPSGLFRYVTEKANNNYNAQLPGN